MNGVHAATFRVLDVLEHASIPYALMGGVATQILAIPTATFDVDLTIRESDVDRAVLELHGAGLEVPAEHLKGFRDRLDGMAKFRVIHRQGDRPVDVDIFVVTTPFQVESFRRRREAPLAGRSVWVFTPEDIIVYKLMAWRPKDRGPIQNLLLANPSVDRGYLRTWADQLGIAERLTQALRDADEFWK